MKKNIGSIERGLRVVLGLALLAWAIWGTGTYTWIGWVGIVPLATGLLGWCLPYQLLGINTCPATKNK